MAPAESAMPVLMAFRLVCFIASNLGIEVVKPLPGPREEKTVTWPARPPRFRPGKGRGPFGFDWGNGAARLVLTGEMARPIGFDQ
jgi:hypothetical protein